jgi:hypothetical protein
MTEIMIAKANILSVNQDIFSYANLKILKIHFHELNKISTTIPTEYSLMCITSCVVLFKGFLPILTILLSISQCSDLNHGYAVSETLSNTWNIRTVRDETLLS